MATIDDIWLTDFGDPYPGEPAGTRPALVIGPPDFYGPNVPFAIVAPLTTTNRGWSTHVEVDAAEESGLRHASYVQCEQLRSVGATRLIHKIGEVDAVTSHRVSTVVKTLLNH